MLKIAVHSNAISPTVVFLETCLDQELCRASMWHVYGICMVEQLKEAGGEVFTAIGGEHIP